jgi:hypothetical protein
MVWVGSNSYTTSGSPGRTIILGPRQYTGNRGFDNDLLIWEQQTVGCLGNKSLEDHASTSSFNIIPSTITHNHPLFVLQCIT